jgi:hypothetical protein
MGRQLKVFTGTALAATALARAVGQTHHVGQVTAYVAATSKAAAVDALTRAGVDMPASRAHLATGIHVAALNEAGLFADPVVLVTHLNGTGPVARINDDRSPAVIGELVTRDLGTTLVGAHRIPEHRTRFVPATEI